ncbi:MAG: lysophospholipid acyltransferase family protein [Bacteroidia bacterium]|nr:lysophospholipid acyltransferase family protein [Bacteroidia bacterium]
MLEATPSRLGYTFWYQFTRIGLKRQFHTVEIIEAARPDPSKSILLVGNHIGWWDGFWALWLTKQAFHRQFYVMMLESQLRLRMFLRHTGTFSIAPGTRDALTSIQYTIRLLADPQNLVLMFPQGKIHSQYDETPVFQPGITRLLQQDRVQVVAYAALMDYSAQPRQTLRFYTDVLHLDAGADTADVQAAYHAFYARAKSQQIARISQEHQ